MVPFVTRLEDLSPNARIRGVLPDRPVTVVQTEWHGTQALTLTYRDDTGKLDHELSTARVRPHSRSRKRAVPGASTPMASSSVSRQRLSASGGAPPPPGGDGEQGEIEGIEAGQSVARRFYGTVSVDPVRMSRDAGQIADEVVKHLVGLVDATVEVRIEIEATTEEGFPDDVVRTVTENAKTLKFDQQGFEES